LTQLNDSFEGFIWTKVTFVLTYRLETTT